MLADERDVGEESQSTRQAFQALYFQPWSLLLELKLSETASPGSLAVVELLYFRFAVFGIVAEKGGNGVRLLCHHLVIKSGVLYVLRYNLPDLPTVRHCQPQDANFLDGL